MILLTLLESLGINNTEDLIMGRVIMSPIVVSKYFTGTRSFTLLVLAKLSLRENIAGRRNNPVQVQIWK